MLDVSRWTDSDWADFLEGSEQAARESLRRACSELRLAATRIESLPPRVRRRLPFELGPDYLRNEAERGIDTLKVYDHPDRSLA